MESLAKLISAGFISYLSKQLMGATMPWWHFFYFAFFK